MPSHLVAGNPWNFHPIDRLPLPDGADADVIVVGAGLVGLAAALAIRRRRPDQSVILVDADRLASGASGRGTGLLGPRAGSVSMPALRKRLGPDGAAAAYSATESAVATVVDELEQAGVCLPLHGQLMVARTEAALRTVHAEAAAYDQCGIRLPLWDRESVREQTGVRYAGGLYFPQACGLSPSTIVGALEIAADTAGVRIHGGTPVLGVHREGGELVLRHTHGRARCTTVLLATNGHTPQGLPRTGVVPVRVHASRSVPLSAAQLQALAGGDALPSVIEVGTLAPYWRLTTDRRLVMGGGPVTVDRAGCSRRAGDVAARAWQSQRRWMRDLHPALAELEVETRWDGVVGVTRDGLPVVGELVPGVFAAGGWNGHGLAMGLWAGASLGSRIAGDPAEGQSLTSRLAHPWGSLPWDRGHGPWVPPEALLRPLLAAGLAVLSHPRLSVPAMPTSPTMPTA
jgi:MYXO-CTERM domain-containing protein